MAKQTNKLMKSFQIARAYVSFAVNGAAYAHPELFLRKEDGQTVIKVRFQANSLTGHDAFGGSFAEHKYTPAPSPQFDFGPRPYSACYAARFDEGMSYGFGSLSAEPNRSNADSFRKLAKFADKIEATIREFDLQAVNPDCQLTLWVAALEKLGVSVEVRRWIGDREIGAIWELPEEERHPARKLLDARKEAQEVRS